MSAPQKLMDQLTRRRMAVAKINGLLSDAEHAAMHAIQADADEAMAVRDAEMKRANGFMAAVDHIVTTELVQ